MGQPGRQLPEGQQLLALADDLPLPQAADFVALEQMNGHRELRLEEAAKGLGIQHEEPRRLRHAYRRLVEVLVVRYVRAPRAAVHPALGGPAGFDVDPRGPLRHHQLALDQDVEARRRLALDTYRPRLIGGDIAVLAQRLELFLGQGLEQEQRPQLV